MTTHTFSSAQALLMLIDAHDGKIESRIRLQKEIFLLQWLGHSALAELHFSYHHYGPYSRELSDVLHDTVLAKLIDEDREELGNGYTRYTYSLTGAGQQAIGSSGNGRMPAAPVKLLRSVHWRTLELVATVLFLEEEHRLDQEVALERALRLKPKCQEYREPAMSMVEKFKSLRETAV